MDKITGTVKLANVNGTAQIMFKKRSDFPASGRASAEYVATDENKIYRYDKAAGKYVCIGTNPDGLQKQIDNIVIAGTGSGDAAAEVAQARVNASGTTFETLKARLDDIDDETSELKEDLKYKNNLVSQRSFDTLANLEFEKGAIAFSDGSEVDGDSVKHIIRSNYVIIPKGTKLTASSEWYVSCTIYDENNNKIGGSSNAAGTSGLLITYTVPYDCIARITLARRDGSSGGFVANGGEWKTNLTIELPEYKEFFSEKVLNNVAKNIIGNGYKNELTFEKGAIAFSDGSEVDGDSVKHIIRSNFIRIKEGTKLTASDEWYVSCNIYDENHNKIGGSCNSSGTSGAVITYTIPYDCIARIVMIRRAGSSGGFEAKGDEWIDNLTITHENLELTEVPYSVRNFNISNQDNKIYKHDYAKSVVFQITKGAKYYIYIPNCNKFTVAFTSEIQYGYEIDEYDFGYKNSNTINGAYSYEFVNNSEANYCIVNYYIDTTSSDAGSVEGISIREEKNDSNYSVYWRPNGLLKGIRADICNGLNTEGDISWTADDIINNIYEPLRSSNSWYITRENIGKDASGKYDMWCYIFSLGHYDKTVYIQGGVHSAETEGYWAVARFCQLLCNNRHDYPELEKLYQTTRFIVVPIVNVWGVSEKVPYNEGTYNDNSNNWWWSANSNNVNLNRDGDNDIKQQETINIHENFEKYKNDIDFCIDSHTTTKKSWGDYLLVMEGTDKGTRPILRTNQYMLNKNVFRREQNNAFMGYSKDYPIGYPNVTGYGITGSFLQYLTADSNSNGCTVEWSDYVFDTTIGTDIAITRATENLVNQIIQNTLK